MANIKNIIAREILDSRGNPTIECDIIFSDNSFGRAAVPSGASTGTYESIELRDNDLNRYNGMGVQKAIGNILNIVKPRILNKEFSNFEDFDNEIIKIDGTNNKSKLGANSTLALSLAFSRALATQTNDNLYEFLSQDKNYVLPVPMINIINGGSHADNNLDIQEFMIAPVGAPCFSEAIRYGSEIFYSLKSKLKQNGYNTNIGDEGGFAPDINSSKKVIELILDAIETSGFQLNKDIKLSLDIASTEFFHDNKYHLKGENKVCTSDQMIDYIKDLINTFPIYSIEDGMSEDDWEGWKNLTNEIGNSIQLVGDDLFVTNIQRLQKGIQLNVANSILVKVNQIGTLSETLSVINLAKQNNYSFIISHRSGETEDTTISDLAVATSSGQIKTGSISRTERTAKYNQLLRIEEALGNEVKYAGRSILKD